ncbi:MAG: helix-turn-helix transcriptional regulator [Clostridia bacterium]|nr:helix-turn-helix transcriptional regulator [Clostridia bacterium]
MPSPIAERICKIIDSCPEAEMTVAEIAEAIGISVWYMSHIFRREMGMTVVEYRTEKRMNKAKILLSSTDKSITEIAYACGFSGQGYFSERFAAVFGISPTKYRIQSRTDK